MRYLMLSLSHATFQLPFHRPFTTAHGTKTVQPALLVSLSNGRATGYGEATQISYYPETLESMTATLAAQKGMIQRYSLTDPPRFWHFLHHLIPGQPFLTAALDMAAWDCMARMRRLPLYKILGVPWQTPPLTDRTIGFDTKENMLAALQANPWPSYKLKLPKPDDVEALRFLRLHTNAPFRIDANEGWDFDSAKRLLPELAALGVELLEQPLPRQEWEAQAELKVLSTSTLPIYADEACQEEEDVARCAGAYHGINIKLSKCSGLSPAIRMIPEAKKLGLKVMLGGMNESSVGAAAIAQLLPLADAADIDGPLLLAEDLAEGLSLQQGAIHFTEQSGLGIRLRPEVLDQLQ